MIDEISNGIQIAVLLVCIIVALFYAVRMRNRAWTLLAFVIGSWWMGEIFWSGCLLLLGDMPLVGWVSDLNWYASFVFLYLLLRELAPPEGRIGFLPWFGPMFTFGMVLYFIQWGEILNNIVYASLMGLLLFAALRRLRDRERYGPQRFLCVMILILCLLEYALWTASCIWREESWANPYYWCDILLTGCFPFFLPATKRVMSA